MRVLLKFSLVSFGLLLAAPGSAGMTVQSSAPAPATFGEVQTVRAGEALVPPRAYAKGTDLPDPAEHASNEVGWIYDIAYLGIEKGKLQFEVRGYSIDDLANPGSGQIRTADRGESPIHIRDLVITVKSATADRITYTVEIEREPVAEPMCTPEPCGEAVEVGATPR